MIAYTHFDRVTLDSDVYTMTSGGSNPTNLTNNPLGADFEPDYSPDGSRIVYSAFDPNLFDFEIFIMSSSGANSTNITKEPLGWDRLPDWSP